ncbi:MAG TPA: 2-amino-4-hydroxy-6-hydroxymethyldihydropteridine diphosphokinase [Candidatus Omnitrophota bacterium]|mgnify:CR=1 FL=1|nr:2-amino-4-hydroxy-6-hydroxymethyldihydropteridine diphosphokinase [Candidatus Omnitrophota bacterium]HPS37375.1 2-amino-4-hydroxy-6-hydroxymethyldihydropteridine diphosphokinase [Candidatus Omnitrophota bacterium]
MPTVFIGIGSNLGDREKNIQRAKDFLGSVRGVRITGSSSIRETDPVGGPKQGNYLNAVWRIETDLDPERLLEHLQQIETQLGRERKEKNGPRILDLDLLAYGNEVIREKDLTVPHPRMHERVFVLQPFCDLAPEWTHPVLKKTVKELLNYLEPLPGKS